MTVAAVMLVKDEADVVEWTLRHLAGQVDEVIVADNVSGDGTTEIIAGLAADGLPIRHEFDPEPGYFQDRKTTNLAMLALDRGHRWVIPCDADEFWYAPDGRPLRDWLAGLAPDVQFVTADLYNHLPSVEDPAATCLSLNTAVSACASCADVIAGGHPARPCDARPNPFQRIGWRQRNHGALPKVACRLRPDLRIHMGNHSASTDGTGTTVSGLVIRHYSWRSPQQYLRKIRNGEAAYAATDMDESVGAHWRMFRNATDEAIVDHFWNWFFSANPRGDDTLIYDPIVAP